MFLGKLTFFPAMAMGGEGGKSPPKDFKKGENEKNMGYFHASKVIKISFSVIFNKEIHALEGLLSRF